MDSSLISTSSVTQYEIITNGTLTGQLSPVDTNSETLSPVIYGLIVTLGFIEVKFAGYQPLLR